MSSSIYFNKTPVESDYFGSSGLSLKKPFANRFSDHDGTLCNELITLTSVEIPWVDGLISAGSYDKDDLKILNKIREILLSGDTVDWWIS